MNETWFSSHNPFHMMRSKMIFARLVNHPLKFRYAALNVNEHGNMQEVELFNSSAIALEFAFKNPELVSDQDRLSLINHIDRNEGRVALMEMSRAHRIDHLVKSYLLMV